MKRFDFKGNILKLFIAAAITMGFASCSDDEDPVDETIIDETPVDQFIITGGINGENYNNSYYTVPFEDLMSGSLSFIGEEMLQMGYYSYNKFDGKIFCSGGLGATSLYVIEQNEDGTLSETVSFNNFDNSIVDMTEGADNEAVAIEMSSTSDIVRLHTISTSSLEVTKTVDTPIASISTESVPAYSGMVVSGDYLYLSFYISDPDTWATTSTDKAEVAVFNYPDLTFVKVIEDSRVGPIGGFGTMTGLIKDESGNVYAVSHSNPANGFSQYTKSAGILKINSGETEFDSEFFFDIEAVTGGYNTAHVVYLDDGKVFTEINVTDRSEQTTWSDGTLKTAIMDLDNSSIEYIDGIPEHAGVGRKLSAMSIIDDSTIYMTIPEDAGIFVYKIDTSSYTATKGAEVEVNFMAGMYKL